MFGTSHGASSTIEGGHGSVAQQSMALQTRQLEHAAGLGPRSKSVVARQ